MPGRPGGAGGSRLGTSKQPGRSSEPVRPSSAEIHQPRYPEPLTAERVGNETASVFNDQTAGSHRSRGYVVATLKEVAAHADVSVQTVSNALNAPHRLRPDTLQRVTRSIELLNYRPNRNARTLRTSAVELIGYCVPNWPDGQVHLVMDLFLHALCSAAETTDRHI